MPGGREFRLEDEQRAHVRDCLVKAQIGLDGPSFETFLRAVEASIAAFQATEAELSFREKHDLLRMLWDLAHEDDPRIGIIRARIEEVPNEVMDYIDYRARNVVPRLEEHYNHGNGAPQEAPSRPLPASRPCRRRLSVPSVDREVWVRRGGFGIWARTAPADLLREVVAVLTAEGAQVVPGRGRGGSKRSAARLEPRIRGSRGTWGEAERW